MKIFLSAITILALFVALAGPAAAQNGYSGTGGQVQTQVQDTGSATSGSGSGSDSGNGSLPFTGLDVALLAGAGLLLAGAGFAMRRVTRAPSQAA
jgi:hypothetical protein